MTTTTTSVTPTAGGRPRPAARRRRMVGRGRRSFMAVFLGLPLAIYLIFVIYPFGQALYYSTTDWSGFRPTGRRVRPCGASGRACGRKG